MKAAVCRVYGPPEVVDVVDVPTPEPKAGEVLVRVVATTVSSGDARVRAARVPKGMGAMFRLVMGLRGPRVGILGTELCGEVVALGPGATRFKVGDRVVAFPGVKMRCHAEFRAVPESAPMVAVPASLSDEEAGAMAFGGTTALYFLRDKGGIRAGQRVLVIGASGAVGSAGVQIARHFGAEVTGVSSAGNHELLRSIGADHVIDYATEDFTRNGERYDLILDTVNATTFDAARGSLTPEGRLLMVDAGPAAMIGAVRTRRIPQKAFAGMAPERADDLRFLAELAEAGAYRPVIDSVHPLSEIARAHERVDTRRKRGSVVVRMG